MDGNARCSGAALGPDFVTGAGPDVLHGSNHAVVQLGTATAACRHTEEWEEGVDRQANVATNIVAVKTLRSKGVRVGLMHAGGVFGEEFGDHRFAPAFQFE